MRHLNWKIDGKFRNHWMNAMLSAMDQIDLEPEVRELMLGYFVKVANHMVNHE